METGVQDREQDVEYELSSLFPAHESQRLYCQFSESFFSSVKTGMASTSKGYCGLRDNAICKKKING